MTDKSKGWGKIPESVEVIRLLLLARLVEETGIVWRVKADWCYWDLIFMCRYGREKQASFQTQSFELEQHHSKSDSSLINLIDRKDFTGAIDKQTRQLVRAYRRRMEKTCPVCQTELMPTGDPGIYQCHFCVNKVRKE